MFKAMLLTLLLSVLGNTEYVTFNDYPDDATPGDRTSTSMLNRHAVAGMLRCKVPNVPATEFNHFFGPGEFTYDARRKMGYYWNHGIQEFAQAGNSSANVSAAYIWGHIYTYGRSASMTATSGCIAVAIDSESITEPVWDMSTKPMYYEVADLYAGSTNTGTYTGWDDGGKVWTYDSLPQAIAAQRAYNVTNAVKYIMDHANEDSLGIMVKSTGGDGQLGIPAEENSSIGMGFYTLLTIVYNGTPAVEASVKKAPSMTLAQNTPNPSVGGTSIRFSVPEQSNVRLAVYTVSGQLVKTLANGSFTGSHTVAWNGIDSRGLKVNSGVYIYKLTSGGKSLVKKMIIMQ